MTDPFIYLTDPILRAPTVGSMLMCLAAGLVGVIVYLRKQALVGEALSHAAYPGVIMGIIATGSILSTASIDSFLPYYIMAGAALSAYLGFLAIIFLERKAHMRSDSALCLVLSSFFGLGITLASQVQFSYSTLYQQIQVYLYGQAATMRDVHVVIYGSLAAVIALTVFIFYKEIVTICFDRSYAKTVGIKGRIVDNIMFTLIVAAVVIGIRSVGVVLMSAMLIAPAATARQFTNKLSGMFLLSALFGVASGFLGNILSVELNQTLLQRYAGARISLPTGPMIVLVASTFCLLALMFAPQRGVVLRLLRAAKFKYKCLSENILKGMWRNNPDGETHVYHLQALNGVNRAYIWLVLKNLEQSGWLEKTKNHCWKLTVDGKVKAAKIVRLHRLWEVYLAAYLGIGEEKVHCSAEEMEHIITKELEEELTLLLKDPKVDPHLQPIPPKEISNQ